MKFRRKIYTVLLLLGIDPRMGLNTIRQAPGFWRNLRILKSQSRSAAAIFPLGRLFPCLSDNGASSGTAKGHYFHQDLLVARRIYLNSPKTHVDVGSRVDGFVAHVACFRPIEVFDVRTLVSTTPNIKFVQGDLMAPLNETMRNYCDSLSCLHALEHFGLGRYGDPVNFNGHLLGLDNLHNMLKTGGKLYLSVPIGPQRIEFNAHRVFAVKYLLECFRDRYNIDNFSFVDDGGDLHESTPLENENVNNNFGCNFGCGIFEMTKL